MPNLTPGDVHVVRPVGTDHGQILTARMRFARSMDNEWTNRRKQAKKRKVKPIDYTPDGVAKMLIQKKFHSAKNRRALAAQGKALPNESYPIEDTEDLKNAATLAQSGHGDVGAAKRLIARRARELGAANPLAKKPAVAKSSSDIVLTSLSEHFSHLTD
jgi:hypothetical protein